MHRLITLLFIPLFGLLAQNAWINEIHYDNFGTDQDEAIEVVIENASSYNLADFTVTLYNGNNNAIYDTPKTLDQFTQGSEVDGFTLYYYNYSQIQNGSPDGLCLDYQGTVISGQFLSYEGTITASGGPADGMTSTDIGVAEPGAIGKSLQLGGTGASYDAFTWQDTLTSTFGSVNTNQSFSSVVLPEPSNHVTDFAAGTVTSMSIELTWTGSAGNRLPGKYLILGKTGAGEYASVSDGSNVADDSDWSDNNAAFNTGHADDANTLTISGLKSETSYSFIIYPYTNGGSDIDFKTDGTVPSLTVETVGMVFTSIYDIQKTADGLEGDSPFKGQTVQLTGVVTAVKSGSGYFVQDKPGPWNAVYVYDGNGVTIGDSIILSGKVDEYFNFTEIKDLTDFNIVSSENSLPKASVITTAELPQEMYEAVLVRVNRASCTNPDLDNGEWEINDGSGPCRVDDWLFSYAPSLGQIYDITGVGNYSFDNFKILPRSEIDISIFTTAPIITNMGFAPLVPLAAEDFIDTVKVTDNGSVTAVKLRYTINNGTVNEVDMAAAGNDSTFSAVISASAYSDGQRVEYWAYAEDNDAESSEGLKQGFFAGSTNIGALNQLDGDGFPLYNKYYARVTGTATVSDGIFDTEFMHFYIQDDYFGAIKVFDYILPDMSIASGNNYTIAGQVEEYNGMMQITPAEITDNGAGTMPQPLQINIASLIGAEALQCVLVKIVSADTVAGTDPWPASGSNASMTITDDSGVSQIILRIDKDTDVEDGPAPSWPQTITGLLTQYDTESPYFQDYQIMPRSAEDLSGLTGIDEQNIPNSLPQRLTLSPAYPNPFNPSASLQFEVPAAMKGRDFEISVYNNLGQKSASLFKGKAETGINKITWNGRTDQGKPVSSGIYYAVLQTGSIQLSRKLVLLK